MPRVYRPPPILPSQAMKTYSVSTPLATHWRLATCEEIDCPNYLNGWAVAITPDQLGQQFDHDIKASGKRFERLTVAEAEARFPGMSFAGAAFVYVFAPGQPCFYQGTARHQAQVDRPEIFSIRGGDHRATTSERRIMRAQDWKEDFIENQERLKRAQERG